MWHLKALFQVEAHCLSVLTLCSGIEENWGIKHLGPDFPLSFSVFSMTVSRVKPQIRAYFHAISQPL